MPRVAKSLDTLLAQINAMAPGRSILSDGALGDEAHRARKSDHNPDANGVVTARDYTHDPAHGMDAGEIAERLRLSKDPRIKYVISNRRIFSSKQQPWEWREYTGENAHTKHVHVSVMDVPELYDDTKPWLIDALVVRREPMQGPSPTRFSNITATVFGGEADREHSAYDDHVITDAEFGVALPFHFQGARPEVRIINPLSGKSVLCDIVDVGPWNTNDPYWTLGSRPQAETGTDLRGRKTNLAGIDLTPAAALAIGIPGKGKVDWEFAGASQIPNGGTTMATPTSDIVNVLQQALAFFQAAQNPQPVQPQTPPQPPPQATPAAQPPDLQKVLQLITTILDPSAKPMGQVNGALGETIGNLLDGKKTAIGTIGALVTSVLSASPGLSTSIASAVGLGAATPVAPIILPIFLVLAGWGVLGKIEKWAQGTAPPPK